MHRQFHPQLIGQRYGKLAAASLFKEYSGWSFELVIENRPENARIYVDSRYTHARPRPSLCLHRSGSADVARYPYTFIALAILPHVSRRVTVRLKTGFSAVESLSTQKYPTRSN